MDEENDIPREGLALVAEGSLGTFIVDGRCFVSIQWGYRKKIMKCLYLANDEVSMCFRLMVVQNTRRFSSLVCSNSNASFLSRSAFFRPPAFICVLACYEGLV